MAEKKINIGSLGPFIYDDAGTFSDGSSHALGTDGVTAFDQITLTSAPTIASHATTKTYVDTELATAGGASWNVQAKIDQTKFGSAGDMNTTGKRYFATTDTNGVLTFDLDGTSFATWNAGTFKYSSISEVEAFALHPSSTHINFANKSYADICGRFYNTSDVTAQLYIHMYHMNTLGTFEGFQDASSNEVVGFGIVAAGGAAEINISAVPLDVITQNKLVAISVSVVEAAGATTGNVEFRISIK